MHFILDFLIALWSVFLEWINDRPKVKAVMPVAVTAFVLLLIAQIVYLSFSSPVQIQYGSVSGYLTSTEGDPVANVDVLFSNESEGVGVTAKTDTNGYYSAKGILPGSFEVAIQPVVTKEGEEITAEDIEAAKTHLSQLVPERFQSTDTSKIIAELTKGSNRFDINLSQQ